MIGPDFDTNKSTWLIRATLGELVEVASSLMMVRRSGVSESNVWLTKVPNGPRLWIIRERMITAWLVADSEANDPEFALPIPDNFIDHLIEVASGGGGVDIYCNEVEGTIIGRNGDRVVSTDHPTDSKFTERDLPYRGLAHGVHSQPATAEVSVGELSLFSDIVLDFPRLSEADQSRLFPFINMTIGNDQLAWTMDWRRFGGVRTTGSIRATTHGTSHVTFYPYVVARFLKSRDDSDTARIFVDVENSEYVYVTGDKWGIRVVGDREELARWGATLRVQLEESGAEVEPTKSERIPDFVDFKIDDHGCYGSIHVHEDGISEFVRLTHIVVDNVPDTPEVMQEINALNAALVGARVLWRDGEIRVIVEFPAKSINDFESHMFVFTEALRRCRTITVFLPLFSDSQ
jgi:hypothetical protein